MADSNSDRDRNRERDNDNSLITKGLIGRVVAVGLFVVLGTVSVVYMMNRSREKNLHGEADPVKSTEVAANPSNQNDPPKAETKLAGFSPSPPPTEKNPAPKLNATFSPLSSDFESKPEVKKNAPDRMAALDNGKPTPSPALAESVEKPALKPVADPPGLPKQTTLAEFNPKQDFDNSKSKPADALSQGGKKVDEGLKDFAPFGTKTETVPDKEPIGNPNKNKAVPELTARLTENNDNFSPTLKGPTPQKTSEPNPIKEPLRAANANPDGSGLKLFDPNEGQENQKPAPAGPTAFNPFDGQPDPPGSAPQERENQPRSGTANLDRGTNLNPPDLKTQPPAEVRPMQPVSGPINRTPPATSFAGNPSLIRTNPGLSETAPSHRTANVPGERKLEGAQTPSVTIEKLSPREVSVNEVADFVIVIRNVGRVDADDVVVHDQVPANTEFEGSNPPPDAAAADRQLKWNVGSIKAGQEKRIQYQLKPVSPGEIGSVAHVTFATQASMRTMVTKPALEIVHRAKPVAMIGTDVILDVVVSNNGNGPAKNVLIQEDVPAQLQFQDGHRQLEYEVGTLMPGQARRVQLALKAIGFGKLKNTVIATSTGGHRTQHDLEMEVVAPKMQATADGPSKRYLGRQVSHQFKVANPGTASATNVDLIAKLPAGLRFVNANNKGVYRRENHAVYWSMTELAANSNQSVELTTMPVDVGNQDIGFEAVADLNQKAAVVQPLVIEHNVDVFADIDDLVDPIEVGAETGYQIKIVNQGTLPANNVQIQVEFPNGLSPMAVDGPLQNQVNGQRVQFSPINNLKPGETVNLRIRAKGQAPGDHRVVLTMQTDGRQAATAKDEVTRVYSDR